MGLKKNPAAAAFIAGAYDHILIDEMQDTNPLQYLLLESFWNQCNLFCVGDDAQSIYGFRGADFQSIHHFTEVVPDAKVLKLTTNYRSTQEILGQRTRRMTRAYVESQIRLFQEKSPARAREKLEYVIVVGRRGTVHRHKLK